MDSLAVIIYSHNSETSLPACLQSILGQSYPPAEVMVVDDSSNDESDIIVEAFSPRNVGYQALTADNRILAYITGIDATESNIVCCIDAKDLIDPRYFEKGLRFFDNPRVGMVYSDVALSPGILPSALRPRSSDETPLEPERYIHPGSLVRRSAFVNALAFLSNPIPEQPEAWCDWSKLLELGYLGIKQETLYYSAPTNSGTPAPVELPTGACSGEFITQDRFDEVFYLSVNADVKAALTNGSLRTGYEHYTLYGRQERRRARAKS